MKRKFVLALAALCVAPVTIAQDARLQALGYAAGIMNDCAAIAQKITAFPAPPGQNVVAVASARHELLRVVSEKAGGAEMSEAVVAARRKTREDFEKSLTPQQMAFIKNVIDQRGQLINCAREFKKISASSRVLSKTLSDALVAKQTPSEEDKKMGAMLIAYMGASENLVTQLSALSKDVEMQALVAEVIRGFFP